jgi:myo-inositol catabolism protein IolS
MKLLSKYSKMPLAFGGASISGEGAGYGFGPISEGESIDLLHRAFELDIVVYDTAPIYGFGTSEKRIGKAFRQNRDKVFLISKSGVTWHSNKRVDMNNDPKIAESMLHQSLVDLNSDYIDLYMVHWPDARHDIRKVLEFYVKAQNQSKIKHIGLCNTNLEDLNKAKEICKIEVVQSQFNFFENEIAQTLFPYLNENKISFMSWGTLDKGILTDRVNRNRKFEKTDCRSNAPWWKDQDFEKKYLAMDRLKIILKDYNISLTAFALGFNLSFEELIMPICGARNMTQLEDLISSIKFMPSKSQVSKILDEFSGEL